MNDSGFKPLIRFNKEVPGYYINTKAELYSSKSNKILTATPVYDSGRLRHMVYRLSIPKGLYEDYDHKRHDSSNTAKLSLTAHRAVAETWMPLDDHPPEQLKDTWDSVPEVWRQWVRDTALIDHIDDDPSNNVLSNLRWATPKQNQPHRKAAEYSIENKQDDCISLSDLSWNALTQEYEYSVEFIGESGKDIFDQLSDIADKRGESIQETWNDLLLFSKENYEQSGTERLVEFD